MTPKLHAAAGVIALATISSFWLSTVVSELIGSHAVVAAVKTAIVFGMGLLVPAMAVAGATGTAVGRGWKLPQVRAKSRRMKIIAANGPPDPASQRRLPRPPSTGGTLRRGIFLVQTVELLAGATNIALLCLNLRDGLALSRQRRLRRP